MAYEELLSNIPNKERDRHPKDWILVGNPTRVDLTTNSIQLGIPSSGTSLVVDNTGNKDWTDEPFPSISFPSDHAVVSCEFNVKLLV